MNFANPLFFWALLSLAVPVLIHLFRFRRFRTVYFTNVRFLKALQKETHSRSKLRHLLILLMRCLAIASLVFAFARPYISDNQKVIAGSRAISIYIDNSFSMDARGESSTLLDLAKKQASEIVESCKASDRFQLITNDFEGRHQRLLSAEQFKESVMEIKLSPSVKKLSEVLARQSDLLRQSDLPGKSIYLISDFQTGTSDLSASLPDTSIQLNCIHLKASVDDNISLDSVWFEKPYREKSKPETIRLIATNHSGKRMENVPVKFAVDGNQRGLESLAIGPDSVAEKNLVFSAGGGGFHSAELSITDFPIVFDDTYYLSWFTPEAITLLCINGGQESPYLNQLFLKNQAFVYKNITAQQIDYASFGRQNCIILNELIEVSSGLAQELKKFVESGGTVLVIPSLKADLASWNTFLGMVGAGTFGSIQNQVQKVGSLNSKHPIYDDVFEKQPEGIDLPQVNAYLPIRQGSAREEVVMKLQNGDRFISQFDVSQGKIFLTSSPLNEESGNFQKHALFIPTLYKIALYSLPPVQVSYTIGDARPVRLGSLNMEGDQTLKLKNLNDDLEMIPEHRIIDGIVWIYPGNRITKAGNYKVIQGNQEIGRVSFNYNRKESLPGRLQADELEKQLQSSGWRKTRIFDGNQKEIRQALAESDQGKPLWKLFVILALLFLAAEILIIRLSK